MLAASANAGTVKSVTPETTPLQHCQAEAARDTSHWPQIREPQSMMILGDLHAEAQQLELALEIAAGNKVDLILQVGDLGAVPTQGSQEWLDFVSDELGKIKTPMLFTDGNNDALPLLESYPEDAFGFHQVRPWLFFAGRGQRWTWKGTRFAALGGASTFRREGRTPGVDLFDEEMITDEQVAMLVAGGPVDVLLTHDAPTGLKIEGMNDTPSQAENRARLQSVVEGVQPGMILCGHYHRRLSVEVQTSGRKCTGHMLARKGVDATMLLNL